MLINILILLLSFNLYAQPCDNTRLASDFFYKINAVLDDVVHMSCGESMFKHANVDADHSMSRESSSDSNYWFYDSYNTIDDLLDCYVKIIKKSEKEERESQSCDERTFSGVPFAFYFNPKPLDVKNDGFDCDSESFKLQLSNLYTASCTTGNDAYMVLIQTFNDQNYIDKELYLYYNENSILTCTDQKQNHLFYQKILCSYNKKTYTIYIYANVYLSMFCVFSIKLLEYFNNLLDYSSADKTSVKPTENATEASLRNSFVCSKIKEEGETKVDPVVLAASSKNAKIDFIVLSRESEIESSAESSCADSKALSGILIKQKPKDAINLKQIIYKNCRNPYFTALISLCFVFWMMVNLNYVHQIIAAMLFGTITLNILINQIKKLSARNELENDEKKNKLSEALAICGKKVSFKLKNSDMSREIETNLAISTASYEMKEEANDDSEVLIENKIALNLEKKIYESFKEPAFVALFTLYSTFCLIIKCEKFVCLITPAALVAMISYAKYKSKIIEYSIKFRFAFIPLLICLFFFDLTMFNICVYTYKYVCDYCSEDLLKWIVKNKQFDASQITDHTRKKTHSLLFIVFFMTIKNTVSKPKANIVNYFPSFIAQPLITYKVLQEPYNQASTHASGTFLMAFNYHTHLSIIKNDDSIMTKLELFGVIVIVVFSVFIMHISLTSANAHINILCDFMLRLLINSKTANIALKKALLSINNELDINNSINQLLKKTSNYINHKCDKEDGIISKIILDYTDCKKGASDAANQISVLKSISNYVENKYDANDIKHNLRKFMYYFKFITQFCFIFSCLYQKYKDDDLFQQSSNRNFLIQTIIGLPNAITLGVFSEISMDFLSFTSK